MLPAPPGRTIDPCTSPHSAPPSPNSAGTRWSTTPASAAACSRDRTARPTPQSEPPMTDVDRLPTTAGIVIRQLAPPDADAKAIRAMVERCSPATLYRRFHGVARGARAVDLLVSASAGDGFAAWRGNDCSGVGGLALGAGGDCGGEGPSGHLGVLIEDGWQ